MRWGRPAHGRDAMSGDPAPLTAALAATVARYELDSRKLAQLQAVLEVLERDEQAPTSVRDPREAAEAHLADSLVAIELEEIRTAGTLADLGSGAGFPGMALAIARPETDVRLVESQRRKCAFLARLREAAGVGNASIVCARAEDWREGLDVHDVVVARALAPQPVVLEYAAPLLRVGGALVDWRGKRDAAAERDAAVAAETLGMCLEEIRRVVPFARARDRHLHVFTKVDPTPRRFPRRAGMARKRPLGP